MAESFADYVRSGRLQKNFDHAVKKAAEEARNLGLRRSVQTAEAGSAVTEVASTGEKTDAPVKPREQ